MPNGAFGRGDPSTAFDAAGRGYIATMNAPNLTGIPNGYLIQKTVNNGTNWLAQVQGTGVINNFDKEMIAADDIQGSSYANNLYCAWSVLNTNPTTNSVQFNRSINQAVSFSAPITLKTGWGQGTNVQTGPNGEVYVCWADYNNSYADWTSKGLGFCRSTNGGVSFTSAQRVINYTGTRTLNPLTGDDENTLFNGIRVNDFPSMAVDKSNGSHRGRIYVALPVKENGNGKAVIQVSFSDNQGTTWSTPITISIANGRQNWFPWINDDDTNGNLYITYYSLDAATGFSTNTYVAESDDGGATFTNKLVRDVAHTTAPIQGFGFGYAGDYIGITSYGGNAYAAWMDNRSGQWQNYVLQVSAGNPLTGTINQGGNLTSMNTVNFISAGPTSVSFQWPNVTSINVSQSPGNPPVSQTGFIYYAYNNSFWFTLSSNQSITVNFSGTGCGGTTIATRSFTVSGHHYIVTPNPATSLITISPNAQSNEQKTSSAQASSSVIRLVTITDITGLVRQQQEFGGEAIRYK